MNLATRNVEIANCVGQRETNIVTERTARMDAEQHVQTLTAMLQTLTRNPTTQAHAQLTEAQAGRADRHEGEGKKWQAWRISEGWVERLAAGPVVLHRTVGHEPCGRRHERGLARRPGVRLSTFHS